MRGKIRLILIGDVVAKLGRKALRDTLREWQGKFKPHAVIANVENLAHGKGVTKKSLEELRIAGVTAFTGGNHVWQREDPLGEELHSLNLALPANDPRTPETSQWISLPLGKEKLFVLNLLGQVMMPDATTENPFLTFDRLYNAMGKPHLLVVDLHAEVTSEKVAFGYYVDGRASVVYGTHTHIPTADTRTLAGGTGYITDIGMTGSNDSVLGVGKETIIKRFVHSEKLPFDYPENGPAWVNAIYCELDPATGRCISIKQIAKKFTIN